jgi:hypothetical protein
MNREEKEWSITLKMFLEACRMNLEGNEGTLVDGLKDFW